MQEGGIELQAANQERGAASEAMPAEVNGDGLTIAFNPTYLTDGLGSLHSERVTFGFTTPSRPADDASSLTWWAVLRATGTAIEQQGQSRAR